MPIDQTPRALGAGPGPTKTYLVDLPFPWGDGTKVTLPVDQMAQDFASGAWPMLYSRISHALPQVYQSKVQPELEAKIADVKSFAVRTLVATGLVLAGTWFAVSYYRSRK